MIPEHIARLAEGLYGTAFESKKPRDLWDESESVRNFYIKRAYAVEKHLIDSGYTIQ